MMTDSLLILIGVLGALGVTALLVFFPHKGLLARLKAAKAAALREQIEDTLKFMLDRQQEGRLASTESLAGALGIRPKKLLRLRVMMEAQGLARTEGSALALTSAGEKLALQIARAHRLWERYLATEARLPLEKVHREAHRLEHRVTVAQINELDAALGYPQHDPHGDPIPNRLGEFPPEPGGKPLTAWSQGVPGRVVHLEDEPPLAYEQILAEGIKLGQTLRVLEITPERYVLTDGENEYRLAPAVAANIFLITPPETADLNNGVIPLVALNDGEPAEIVNIDETCQGFTRRRFLDLGLTPGTVISPELSNFFGDPRAYRVRGVLIALRRDQAGMVQVRPVQQ